MRINLISGPGQQRVAVNYIFTLINTRVKQCAASFILKLFILVIVTDIIYPDLFNANGTFLSHRPSGRKLLVSWQLLEIKKICNLGKYLIN